MHDLVFKNAYIVDGTGKSPFYGDLAVSDGIIMERGKNLGDSKRVIDAEGLTITPGFIDTHTHYDAQLTWDPWAQPSPSLGVTTLLIGNCGFTIAPCKPEHRDLTLRNLTNVEGMSLEALRKGVLWDFKTFPEYMNFLERRGVGPNIAAYVGHSSVRVYTMGEEASKRSANKSEIKQMEEIVYNSMVSGAIGFATSTFEGHNGENGIPMPSRLAEDNEMVSLIKSMSSSGRGLFMLTKGLETPIETIKNWMKGTNRPAIVAALLHNPMFPNSMDNQVKSIKNASDEGIEMWGQVSCRPLTMEFTMKSPYLFEGFSSWKIAMQALDENEYKKVLKTKELRKEMKKELSDPKRIRLFNDNWSEVIVRNVTNKSYKALEGKNLKEIGEEKGIHPFDWLLDHSLSEDGMETEFIVYLLNTDKAAVGRLLKSDNTTISLSDAGAHLTFFCDAGYGLYMLENWVRKNGLMSIEEAIHRLTGRQADIYRIDQRGRLVPGQYADILMLDKDSVGVTEPFKVNDLPGGATRLTVNSIGLKGVWINGKRVVKDCKLIDKEKLPGKLIRAFHA